MTERRLVVIPDCGTPEANVAGAQELAWGHATEVASLMGEELGSDWFVSYYEDLLERYKICTNHIGFLQHIALRSVRELAENGLALMVKRGATEDDIIERVKDLSSIVVASIMEALVTFPHDWQSNEDWEELPLEFRGVSFGFKIPTESE